ncbi:MAG: hypothetical protein AB7Y46_14470 [Armatimonadota bacterium]
MRTRTLVVVSFLLALAGTSPPARGDDLQVARSAQASFDRCASRVMVRAVERPDRATLDVAAYDRNPLFHYPLSAPLAAPAPAPALGELTFGGALEAATICDRLGETPLTEAERARPLAWQPLTKYLLERNYELAAPLLVVGARVSAERWGNDELSRPLQQIALAYLHGEELWVKVEFRPELTWVPAGDEDGDGYAEIYARLAVPPLAAELREAILTDYMGRTLGAEEIDGYFYQLCSDWYQSLQTYLLAADQIRPWPNAETEAEVAGELDGRVIANPTAVIRGLPYGTPMYNVFVVAGGEATAAGGAALLGGAGGVTAAGEAEELPAGGDWQGELARWGGSWEGWVQSLGRFRADLRAMLQDVPDDTSGIVGRDGWLFFRGDLEYLLAGDLRDQPEGKNPWPAILDFHRQLQERGVDLLVVVIPTKAEVYPEKLSVHAPGTDGPWVAPYCRKLLSELSAAGVHVVDLLPAFMAQRDRGPDPLYMPQDTHWTNRGVRLAATLIARRVRAYQWYGGLGASADRYGVRPVPCTRLGDIVGMLPEAERAAYRPMQLEAQQVVGVDGTPYADDQASPIVMLGDSFTGVFHFEDCKHAGLSAHLARELGLPIDLIMAQGSGPRIRVQLARRGPEALTGKRLVIWTMVSRDLHNYWANWDMVALP